MKNKLCIWLVYRTDEVGYDEYSSVVVFANTEEDALKVNPRGMVDGDNWGGNVTKPLGVILLGTASVGHTPGEIACRDFRAG